MYRTERGNWGWPLIISPVTSSSVSPGDHSPGALHPVLVKVGICLCVWCRVWSRVTRPGHVTRAPLTKSTD